MKTKKRYNWSKDPDASKYCIWDVEVFQAFSGMKEGDKITVTEEDLQEVIRKAIQLRDESGELPRVFCGHHTGPEDRPGAGFLDNLRLLNGYLIADIVGIKESVFKSIQEGDFPYRSPEYLHKSKELLGLALLESQKPYFSFPMLILEKEEVKKLYKFQKKEYSMAISNENSLKPGILPDNEDEKPEEKVDEVKFQEEPKDEVKELLVEVVRMLKQLLSMEKKEASEKVEEKPVVSSPTSDPASESSVAYQLRAMEQEIRALRGQQSSSNYNSKLNSICSNFGLDYATHSSILQRFSSDKDKAVYLESLENPVSTFGASHYMTDQLKSFYRSPIDGKEKLLSKFHGHDSIIANKSFEAYRDTVLQKDRNAASKFQAIWGETPEKFVEYCVDNPAEFERMISPLA